MTSLAKISNKLCRRINQTTEYECTADHVADALLIQTGGVTEDAIRNGNLYYMNKRPIIELTNELNFIRDASYQQAGIK